MTSKLNEELSAYLSEQAEQHRYRSRTAVSGPQGIELTIDNKKYLNFCSNDYLGLANHPKLIEALQSGAQQYGVGSGASHLINGHSDAHHALEIELAEFVQRPRALLFSTGYMANLGVVTALLGQADCVFADRLNHASLNDAAVLSRARLKRYGHGDVDELCAKLAKTKAQRKLVLSDGVFSMDGDVAPMNGLVAACEQTNAILMIDDAHGLGAIGANGGGTLELYSKSCEDVPILMGTLGKAFGTFGAFVAGSEELIETLIQKARTYIYTTAVPAAIAQATRASIKVIKEETWRREKLAENIGYFRQQAIEYDISLMDSLTAIQPILIGDVKKTVAASEALREQGLLVSAIRPPTVAEGTSRLRVTLCTEHSKTQILSLIKSLRELIIE